MELLADRDPEQARKQDGHLLALAFEGGLRFQDAFGEVLRRVRLGRGKTWGRGVCRGRSSRMGALRAELGSRGKLRPAVGTYRREGCGALLAELRAGAILVLAPRAFHPGRSRSQPGSTEPAWPT